MSQEKNMPGQGRTPKPPSSEPAIRVVIDGHDFAVQEFGVERRKVARFAAQGRGAAGDGSPNEMVGPT